MNDEVVEIKRASHPPTFREHLEALRVANAARAFTRGQVASSLRHCAMEATRKRSAKQLGRVKQAALQVAVAIAPDVVRVGIDDEFHVGLLSIAFPGRGRLHLPLTSFHPAA